MANKFSSFMKCGEEKMDTGCDFDAHCHVFDLEYLLLEMEQMLLDGLRGRYPMRRLADTGVNGDEGGRIPVRGVVRKALIMLHFTPMLFRAACGDETKNAEFVFAIGKKVFKKDIAIIPLMMDFYFAFGAPLPAPKQKPSTLSRAFRPKRRQHSIEEVEPKFRRRMAGVIAEGGSKARKGELHGKCSDYVALVKRTMEAAIDFQKRDASADPYVKTVGFEYQLRKLKELRSVYPDRTFPFFAIDPRREGIVDYIVAGNYVSKEEGPFFGCKLYPRAGYMPDVRELDPLYSYCEKIDVPVTTHCSRTGFPPAALIWRWKLTDFGAPKNYAEVLKRHPKLRLNLAHFGGGGQDRSWSNDVTALMAACRTGVPNESRVFSDLSGYTAEDHSDLVRWWREFADNDLVKNQTMFGSDFDVMVYTTRMTLEEYNSRFNGGARVPLPLSTMMGSTVRRFLGKDKANSSACEKHDQESAVRELVGSIDSAHDARA